MTRQTLVTASILAATGTLAGCAPASEPVGGAQRQVATTDADMATLRICHSALALEHNTFVEYDWNTAWESAANLEPDVRAVQDEGIRQAAQAALETVPGLLEDEEMSDEAFIEAIVPIMSGLYYACEEWSADHLYGD